MKKIVLLSLAVILGSFIAGAQTIDDFIAKAKTSEAFSFTELPKEQAKQQGFDAFEIGISETVSTAVFNDVDAQLKLIPQDQQLVTMNENGQYVAIFFTPIDAKKSQILIVALTKPQNATTDDVPMQGAIIKGICDTKDAVNNIQNLKLDDIFGE